MLFHLQPWFGAAWSFSPATGSSTFDFSGSTIVNQYISVCYKLTSPQYSMIAAWHRLKQSPSGLGGEGSVREKMMTLCLYKWAWIGPKPREHLVERASFSLREDQKQVWHWLEQKPLGQQAPPDLRCKSAFSVNSTHICSTNLLRDKNGLIGRVSFTWGMFERS